MYEYNKIKMFFILRKYNKWKIINISIVSLIALQANILNCSRVLWAFFILLGKNLITILQIIILEYNCEIQIDIWQVILNSVIYILH